MNKGISSKTGAASEKIPKRALLLVGVLVVAVLLLSLFPQ